MDIRSARLIVSTRDSAESSISLKRPSLDDLTDALSDLYARLGCEAPNREVKLEIERESRRTSLFAQNPEDSPQKIAAALWDQLPEPRQ